MQDDPPTRKRQKRRKSLNQQRLNDLALAYVARYATSSARLESYLRRKLHESDWEGEDAPDPAGLVARFAEHNYVDDDAYAQMRTQSLLRAGYGLRRVGQALHQAGIDETVREQVMPGEAEQRMAIIRLAQRRGFGPFARTQPDRKQAEKHFAALVRAGHTFAHARFVLQAGDENMLEEWLAEAKEPLE